MRARRPNGHDDHGSVKYREREGPSSTILETSVCADQRKTEETAGGGVKSEDEAGEGAETSIQYGQTNERGQEGQAELGGTTTTKGEEGDVEVGSTLGEACNTKHEVRSAKGQETSMHPEEWQ